MEEERSLRALWGQQELGEDHPLLVVRDLIDQMPGGFFIYRADGNEEILYVNQAMVRLMGCETADEFYALTEGSFRGILHPEDYQAVEESIWEQINGSHYDLDYVEYRIVRKDGEVRWVEDYGHFVRDEEGHGLFYVFAADATDKRRRQIEERAAMLEAANHQLRRQLRIIEGFSRDYKAIFYADLDRDRIQPYQVSPRFAGYLKVGEEQGFAGFDEQYIAAWVHPEDRETVRAATDPAQIRARFETCRDYYVNYRTVEGETSSYFQLQVVDVSGPNAPGRVVLGYRSVDAEIRSEMERRSVVETALEKANAAAEAKNAFLSNMSHDLRTPMNAVVGYTALVRNNLDDREKVEEYLEKIDTASAHVLEIIDNILDLAQLEGGKTRVKETACDLGDIVLRSTDSSASLAEKKGVAVSVDLSEVRHRAVYADGYKLGVVLSHLVSNGVKYTNGGGRVTVTVTEHGAPTRDYASYVITVEDTGMGIGPKYLERIFEPFEREHNTTFSGVLGVGLGLTIVKSTVELMGGTIGVESQVGRGSRFTVTLSLALAEEGDRSGEDKGAAHRDGHRRRVLLVDDNELNRELCAELLLEAGYLVDTAENGREAVDRVRESRPGYYILVLMDIQMPVMDGNEAARHIRELPDPALANIPIIALSANALETDRKRSMESGMNAHLSKPVQIDELLAHLDALAPEEGA